MQSPIGRIGIAILCVIWSLVCLAMARLGDLLLLCVSLPAIAVGLAFSVYGYVPVDLKERLGIAENDHPNNISPRVYLPVIGVVVLFAVLVSWWMLS